MNQLLTTKEIPHIEKDFSPDSIQQEIEKMVSRGFEPDTIFLPLKFFTKLHHWNGKSYVQYSTLSPRPRLDSSFVIDKHNLKIVLLIDETFSRYIVLLNEKAATWHVRRSQYGALYIQLGNDMLYPEKYVELIAMTTIKCEINPNETLVLTQKT